MNTKIPPAMMEAIWEEPGVIAACCGPERNRLTGDFVKLVLEKPIQRIYFCGSGSVANTGMILKQAAEKWLGVEAPWSIPAGSSITGTLTRLENTGRKRCC